MGAGVSSVWGELARAEAEKARLAGVLKAGLFPAEPLLGIYLTGYTVIEYKDVHCIIV